MVPGTHSVEPAAAALLLAIYAFVFAIPVQREHNSSLAKLDRVRRTAVSQEAAELSEQNLELAEAALRRLNEQITADKDRIRLLASEWNDSDSRLPTVQQVTELLQQFNLSILRQSFEAEPPISAYLKELETIVKNHSSEEQVEYWKLELTGSYTDMMKFLYQIKASGLRTFPLTISMVASESGDGVHEWTVVFVV